MRINALAQWSGDRNQRNGATAEVLIVNGGQLT